MLLANARIIETDQIPTLINSPVPQSLDLTRCPVDPDGGIFYPTSGLRFVDSLLQFEHLTARFSTLGVVEHTLIDSIAFSLDA